MAGELLYLPAQDAQAGGRGRSGGTRLPLTLVPHFPPRRFHWHGVGASLVGAFKAPRPWKETPHRPLSADALGG